jgi:3',5'-cyclic AMP phosphodiesterase CpdA
VRVVHFTDLHFHHARDLGRVVGKRALGLANLYLGARRYHYDAAALVPRLVDAMMACQPDLAIFSGDLTALSTVGEFEAAREALDPLLRSVPTVLIPGNHDRYARDAAGRMERYFGPWMSGGRCTEGASWQRPPDPEWPHAYEIGALTVLSTDCNRPGILSNGLHSEGQLQRLTEALRERGGQRCLVVGHYPVLDRDGAPYEHRGRRLLDREELQRVLVEAKLLAYLHGHEHRWFVQDLAGVLVLGCGSSSYVGHDADKRAGFFEIEVRPGTVEVLHRHSWDGAGFEGKERV